MGQGGSGFQPYKTGRCLLGEAIFPPVKPETIDFQGLILAHRPLLMINYLNLNRGKMTG